MKRYKTFIAIFFWILSLVMVALVSTRVATDEAKKQYDPFTAEEIIKFGNEWLYTIAIQYADGGSWDLGFIDSNGMFVFLRINSPISEDHEYRKFYLSKNLFHGRDFIEVIRGSDLESKVINLIEESRDLNTNECKVLPDKSVVVDLLKSRDMRIIIDSPTLE